MFSDILNEHRCDPPITAPQQPDVVDQTLRKPLNPFIDLDGRNPPRYFY